MPSWVVYPEFDRVRWLNMALKELWPHLSAGVSDQVLRKVEPMLKDLKPAFLSSLKIKVISTCPQHIALNLLYFLPGTFAISERRTSNGSICL